MRIEEHINKYLEEKNKEERVRSGKYNPSSLGKCYKAQIMNRKDMPKSNPPDERALRIFAVGNIFHDWIQKTLPEHQSEVPVEHDHFCGRADIVVDDMVIEMKSQHSNAWHWMTKDGYDFTSNKKHDILQVTYYAYMLGKPKASLVYISKDDLCIYQHTFEIKHFEQELRDELTMLIRCWEDDIIPSGLGRAYGKDKKTGRSNECYKYCPYRDVCNEKGF